LMALGLTFGAVGCYGIAAAEFWGIYSASPFGPNTEGFFGLSWVAAWMLFFIIVIPSRPRRSLLAALGSATAPAIIILLSMKYAGTRINISAEMFFAGLVLPYLLCALLAYVGARVVYKLGTEVRKARELGSYLLEGRLGSGGMGEVWKARHKMLARPAAIKFIRPEFLGEQDPDSRKMLNARFEREAQATASMRSPHTIEVYDFGVADDGTFYYVMELLDGLDLETFGKRFGAMPPERVIHILRQVCHSLGEAHEARLIHRDIKPANIFICRYGREVDYVKVLDFGLVKTTPFSESDDPMLTGENVVTGTPAFMAPEQILGNRPVDARSDLYSLGCVGFWMLTGDLVFEGETLMQTMTMHAEKPAPSPSEQSELEIPEELDRVILMCLEKDPNKRPQSADDLSRLLENCPVENPWGDERARRWWETNQPSGEGRAHRSQ
jgi:serine/threonine protein kinase